MNNLWLNDTTFVKTTTLTCLLYVTNLQSKHYIWNFINSSDLFHLSLLLTTLITLSFILAERMKLVWNLFKKFIACLSTAIGKEYYCYVFFLHQSIIDYFHISFLLFYIHVHGCCLCLPNCLPHLLSVIYWITCTVAFFVPPFSALPTQLAYLFPYFIYLPFDTYFVPTFHYTVLLIAWAKKVKRRTIIEPFHTFVSYLWLLPRLLMSRHFGLNKLNCNYVYT